MDKNTLIDILTILKKGRKKLLYDFINEKTDIFEAMFKYEDDEQLMSLVIDKYFTEYINYHFELLKEIQNNHNLEINFSKVMLEFINHFDNLNKNSRYSEKLYYKILQDKKNILEELISIGCSDREKFNQLKYIYQKDKRLFDREIKLVGETK